MTRHEFEERSSDVTSTQKVAVITGGSRGLGRNMVLHLAGKGVSSIFTFNSGAEQAKNVAAEAESAGAPTVGLKLDTGDAKSFDGFVDQVRSALSDFGLARFDYLVNNGGISSHTPFTELTEEELDRLYSINFKGVLLLTQRLLPLIKDGGQIINISSGVVRFVNPNSTPYAALKGGIDVFTRYLANDLGPRDINVNSVAPGAIATDFSGGVVRDNPAVNQAIADMTALGRAGEPDDIGGMVASLLTGENHWINAQRIEVSGGMRL